MSIYLIDAAKLTYRCLNYRDTVFFMKKARTVHYGGPEKTLQTDAVMTAHAMREKPLCRPCLIISQVSVNKRA